MTAYTRFATKKLLKENQMAIALHPGWCKTDMGGPQAICSEEDGAGKIYFAMFEANDEKYNNKFFVDNKVYEEN